MTNNKTIIFGLVVAFILAVGIVSGELFVNAIPSQNNVQVSEIDILQNHPPVLDVECRDCQKLAQQVYIQCLEENRGGVATLGCIDKAREARDTCQILCKDTKRDAACLAKDVQHWNKIVFKVPENKVIERDGYIGGYPGSLNEVIVQAEPNDIHLPYVLVEHVLSEKSFSVIELDENGTEIRRHNQQLFPDDIEIVDIEYSNICAIDPIVAIVNPQQPNE